jgi:hypothetical protein
MTGHITAAELRGEAESARMWQQYATQTAFHRAAAALDAKDARIAELEEQVASHRSWRLSAEYVADAELGALVRRCRDHAENGNSGIDWTGVNVEDLQEWLAILDSLAASREAERGVEGPSGRRYQVRDGWVERWRVDTGGWVSIALAADIPTVAALIERHGGKDGE